MSNADSMIETVSSILSAAESIVSAMPDKSRVQLKELTQSVASTTGMDPKDVLTFVTFFARNTDLGYVSRGKNGGLIRGSKPLKSPPVMLKSSPPSDDSSLDEVDDSSDEDSSEEE